MAQDIYIRFKGDTSDLLASVNRVQRSLRGLDRTSQRAAQSMNRLQRSSSQVGISLRSVGGALAAIGTGAAVRGIVSSYTEFERYRTVLTTFLGSADAANKELQRLQKLANGLPQDLSDLTNAFTIFSRFGLDTTNETLTAFSNIATANAKSMTQLGEAVADALTGEFERLKEFGIKVSKENDNFVARIGSQQVALAGSSEELVKQLIALGAEGGRFAGAAAANADTLNQAFSNLRGSLFSASVALMEGLRPALVNVINSISDFVNRNNELINQIGTRLGTALQFAADNADKLAIALGGIFAFRMVRVVGGIVSGIGKMSAGMAQFAGIAGFSGRAITAVGTNILRLAGPIGFAVSAALVLFKGFQSIKDKTIEVGNTTTTYGELARAVFSKVGNMAKTAAEYLRKRFVNAYDSIKGSIASFFNKHSESLSRIGNALRGAVNTYIGIWYGMFEWLRKNVTNLPRLFGDALVATGKIIGDFAMRALKSLGQALNPKNWFDGEEGVAYFEGFKDDVAATFSNVGSNIEPIDWDTVLNTDYIGKGTEFVQERMATMYSSVSGVAEDLVLDFRASGDAMSDAGEGAKEFSTEVGKIPEVAEPAAAALGNLGDEAERILAAFRATPEAADIARAGIGAFERFNPLEGINATYRNELRGLELLRRRDQINEEEYLRTKQQLHEEYSRNILELNRSTLQAQIDAAGITNTAIKSSLEQSLQNFTQIQQGGVQAAMGMTSELGNIFGQLGQYNKRAFQAAKAFNIANAIMNTYLGATKALAMFPPPFNFIAAAGVVAAGLAQVAAIRSQTYSGRALGGPVMGGESYIVGENGPELFTPAQSGSITRNDQLDGMGDKVEINFTINAIDQRGIDEVLIERRSVIQQIISDAMLEKGNRSRF
jgi:hypothetical protein